MSIQSKSLEHWDEMWQDIVESQRDQLTSNYWGDNPDQPCPNTGPPEEDTFDMGLEDLASVPTWFAWQLKRLDMIDQTELSVPQRMQIRDARLRLQNMIDTINTLAPVLLGSQAALQEIGY